jgi:hypothetical protein
MFQRLQLLNLQGTNFFSLDVFFLSNWLKSVLFRVGNTEIHKLIVVSGPPGSAG